MTIIDRKNSVTLEELERSLDAIPGASELIEKERAKLQAEKSASEPKPSAPKP